MSGGDVLCVGWLRKSPPEKKLRRYAWKKRWFVLKSGRLTGDPDVLEYYKHNHARKPIRSINLHLCEQVDAGLSFSNKELQSSHVFDLKTQDRVFYLVADSLEDMQRWVRAICELCGFNPTDDVTTAHMPVTTVTAAHTSVTKTTEPAPPPYQPVSVRHLETSRSTEEYLWLSHCQSRPPIGSCQSTSSEDCNDSFSSPRPPLSSSSSSSSPSSLANGLPSHPHSGSAPWAVATDTGRLSQSQDFPPAPEPIRSGVRSHPSPHPRKYSLEMQVTPGSLSLCSHPPPPAGGSIFSPYSKPSPTYQVPRPSATPTSHSPSLGDAPSAGPLPPPRPPKPSGPGEGCVLGSLTPSLPRSASEPERSSGGGGGEGEGGNMGVKTIRSNTISTVGCTHTVFQEAPRSFSDRPSMFEFSESFNSYFMNKGMMPVESGFTDPEDSDENYVAMTTTGDPPLAKPPLNDANYVAMTSAPPELPSLGRQVPPPSHLGFRTSPLTPLTPLTPPARRHTTGGRGLPPPILRNLKPQHKGVVTCAFPVRPKPMGLERTDSQTIGEFSRQRKARPAPLNIPPLQEWEEVPPPVRSPVTRTFTRDPSRFPVSSGRPSSTHSSASSSDSDDPDDNYVSMTTSSLTLSGDEPSLRLMMHRTSEGGCSPSTSRHKQVEYLDLDLHPGHAPTAAQKRSPGGSDERACERACERARERVDYVVVDPERTRALRSTREAWHDGRQSSDK